MHIVHIASELSNIAKAGGLGDVIHGLAKEQSRSGHDIAVILPKYDIIELSQIEDLKIYKLDLWSFEDAFKYHNTVWTGVYDSIRIYLIEPHHNQYYFNRGQVYGCMNDIERFLYFSRAALEFLHKEQKDIDVLHIHDWPTAVVAPLMHNLYQKIGFDVGSVIFNIHNIEHQGKMNPRALTRIGLRGEDYRSEDLMQDPIDSSLLNLLKAGIVYSDKVITVSPKYAEEIKTTEFAFGLDQTIDRYSDKIHGILNGIEIDYWNPYRDPFLAKCYDENKEDLSKILRAKKDNQKALFEMLHMKPKGQGPIIASITRLVKQKGPKLIQRAIHYTLENGGIFLLLGTTYDHQTEKEFAHIAHHYKNHPNLHIGLEFNEKLAHLMYAAADSLIIPSIFEPCGLTQMISMRYATVPIGRKTGGLADTIVDHPSKPCTGFLFQNPSEEAVESVLTRVFECFREQPDEWQKIIQNGLKANFSWKQSAKAYEKIYHMAQKQKTP